MQETQLRKRCLNARQTSGVAAPLGSADTVSPDRLQPWPLTLKLVWESHLRWGIFLPNTGTLGLWVLELFVMYATDGPTQTDGHTDGRTKATLIAPFSTDRGHNKRYMLQYFTCQCVDRTYRRHYR